MKADKIYDVSSEMLSILSILNPNLCSISSKTMAQTKKSAIWTTFFKKTSIKDQKRWIGLSYIRFPCKHSREFSKKSCFSMPNRIRQYNGAQLYKCHSAMTTGIQSRNIFFKILAEIIFIPSLCSFQSVLLHAKITDFAIFFNSFKHF